MPTIKLFGAEWCQMCKMVKPILERFAIVEYIDVDEDVAQTAEYGVRALPTYINVENGNRKTGMCKNLAEAKEAMGVE